MPPVDDLPTRDLTVDSHRMAEVPREVAAIALVWAREEPARVGEIALVTRRSVLGRGPVRAEDPAPRLELGRQRPKGIALGGPIESGGVSRIQLEIEPHPDGVAVKQLARRPLLHLGAPVERAVVRFGETFEIDDQLLFLVTRRALDGLARADASFEFGAADRYGFVGESPAMWTLRAAIELAARAPAHVLVHGPSGTGKELAARAIHAASSRGGREMVARNAATLPEGLIDAELFGNVRGYPNPGMAERNGLVGEADGSTLFLDEIGELSATLQAHLLRLMDRDGEYQRLGDAKMRRADVRIVAATNRDPASLKHDFAARLVLRVEVPGLDARREDIPLLLRGIFEKLDEDELPKVKRVPTAALVDALVRHRYTTHMRELVRIVWTAIGEGEGDAVVDLGPATRAVLAASTAPPANDDAMTQEEFVDPGADAIRAALASGKNSVTAAAKTLGLRNRYVLYRLMRKHGIEP